MGREMQARLRATTVFEPLTQVGAFSTGMGERTLPAWRGRRKATRDMHMQTWTWTWTWRWPWTWHGHAHAHAHVHRTSWDASICTQLGEGGEARANRKLRRGAAPRKQKRFPRVRTDTAAHTCCVLIP